MTFKNTAEQDNIIAASLTGEHVVVEAGAGAAKTSTLVLIDHAKPKFATGSFLAYNRAIAGDAKAKFSRRTNVSTVHSIAFRALGYKYKGRLDDPRISAKQTASILGVNEGVAWGEHEFGPVKLALMAMGTVTRFCYSADATITSRHVPWLPGTEAFFDELAEIITPYARKAWDDLSQTKGRLRFQHDVYLKLWALTNPTIPGDFIMLDEAQDANPVIEGVVKSQDAQIIMVGDAAQQIYAWRGAQDAMSRFDAPHRLHLTKSFRFGQAVADEANKWLEILQSPLRLEGFEKVNSRLTTLETPKAVLCRTNATVVAEALHGQEDGHKVAIVGGTGEIQAFAEAAQDLMANRTTYHPELAAFKNWHEVQEYVQDEAGSDLKVFVKLIDEYGVEKVMNVARNAVKEQYADVIVSTAHKSKGREWTSVKIAGDFREPVNEDGTPSTPVKAECNLAYVAITRAKDLLDRGGLAWVDNYVNTPATSVDPDLLLSGSGSELPPEPLEEKSIPRARRLARERKALAMKETS